MDVNNDFLRSYKIPIISNSTVPFVEGSNEINAGVADLYPSSTTPIQNNQQELENEGNQVYPNRFVPRGSNCADSSIKRPPKRKLSGSSMLFMGPDESYPDELNALLKPLFCELCNARLNSPKTAANHYISKSHNKGITNWLTRNYTDKGLTAPTVKRFYRDDQGPVGPNAYHCACCDLNLTSKSHAEQHYAGRKHKLVLCNVSKPSGAGYYNAEGVWVRTGKKVINDGRFGIGEQFRNQSVDPTSEQSDGNKLEVKEPAEETQKVNVSEGITCNVCKTFVTSEMQMKIHIAGRKHQRKLKECGGGETASADAKSNDTVLASLSDAGISVDDISMYRTPSGSYYCKTCNLSIVHQSALVQHLVGKKHTKKSSSVNTTTPTS